MRRGVHTSEFALTVLLAVGATAAAIEGSLPPRWAALADAVSVAAYAISRGLAKKDTGTSA